MAEILQAGTTPTLSIELYNDTDIEQTTPIDLSQFDNFTLWLVDARTKFVYAKYSRENITGYLPITIVTDTNYQIILGVDVTNSVGSTDDLELQIRTEKINVDYPDGKEVNIGIGNGVIFEKNEISDETL